MMRVTKTIARIGAATKALSIRLTKIMKTHRKDENNGNPMRETQV